MPEITEEDLKKQIAGALLSNLYLLYGDEKYLVIRYAQKLMEKAGGKDFTNFNLKRFDGDTLPNEAFEEAVAALPFMAETKCVAVSELPADKLKDGELSQIKKILAAIPEQTVVVLYYPDAVINRKKDQKWNAFFSYAATQGCTVEIPLRTGQELNKILCAAAQKRNCELTDPAYLVFLCSNGLETLLREVDKLCAYTGEGKITRETIRLLTPVNREEKAFALGDALLAGNGSRVYEIFDTLLQCGESPEGILALVIHSYLTMYRVKTATQADKKTAEILSAFPSYRNKTFLIDRALRDTRRIPVEVLRTSISLLSEADARQKSMPGDKRMMMETLFAKLLLTQEGTL